MERGAIKRITPEMANKFHERAQQVQLPEEFAERLDAMVSLLTEIAAQKDAVQEVRVKNPGEPARQARRATAKRPPGSPPKGLASY